MKQQISPKIFFGILAAILAVVGTFLYRQATDPIYHKEPGEDDARSQFSKGPSPSTSDSASKAEATNKKVEMKPQGKGEDVSQGATPAKFAPAGAPSK